MGAGRKSIWWLNESRDCAPRFAKRRAEHLRAEPATSTSIEPSLLSRVHIAGSKPPHQLAHMATPPTLTKDEFLLLTYKPNLNNMTIQHKGLAKACLLDNHQQAPSSTDLSNTGPLNAIPLEIIHAILEPLDLQSLTNLRRVSWGVRNLVSTLPLYKAIIQHSPHTLRALLSTDTARYFDAEKIYKALCAKDCDTCGQFGAVLDLFTAHRHCLRCVATSEMLWCVTLSSVRRDFWIAHKIHLLKSLHTLPGKYSDAKSRHPKRHRVFRVEWDLLPPGSPRENPNNRLVEENSFCYRYMPMTRIPTMNPQNGELDWGVCCRACRDQPDPTLHGIADIMYTQAGYSEHFQSCNLSRIRHAKGINPVVSL